MARTVRACHCREVLNYFGHCAACGYPARADLVTTVYTDGSQTATLVATCGLPCGWSGPVPLTTMTPRDPSV
ncbi:hypothetical protein IU433_24330 [Nocardia puris]|uniref:Uncharacterized protein n=1 Tax=Nocardia puris TaxID=208602 RepID=A0A366DHL8_9NOCA|nr:hypothetical protein [Nocardia puris]MBF6213263.1 hypothetical protein [Nocardia puris]MBF6369855.1 hypothetical protein [Nocardia puris]MBF6462142.1 hypothetical protein [Nocardia puris]RBO89445.1 hypothetical protein DFR74_107123 [Nocardia puris]